MEETVILNYRDAFQSLAQIDIFAAEPEELARCADADDSLWQAIGPDRNAWLDLILDAVVAPQFPDHRLTVLQHFPASKAALARLCPADSEVADRFEIFAGNMELANGYVELTDANAQRQRIEDELCQRQNAGLALHPVDNRLLQALDAGLPNCAGVAVGVERLQMVLDQTTDIGDVITFRAEGDGP